MFTRFHYFIAVTGLVISLNSIVESQNLRSNPRTILTKMVATYANASSYQDLGTLRVFPNKMSLRDSADTLSLRSTGRDKLKVSFKTYFGRPQLFRFEWKRSFIRASRTALIWSDGEEVYSWLPEPSGSNSFELSDERSIESAVDSAMKPSGGTAFIVPSLLVPDLSDTFGDVVRDPSDLTMVREEYFDGELCYVIKGKASTVPWVFWVGKKSYLLRKFRSFYTIGSFYEGLKRGLSNKLIAEEIHREVRINGRIPNEIFRYRPRLRVGDTDLTR